MHMRSFPQHADSWMPITPTIRALTFRRFGVRFTQLLWPRRTPEFLLDTGTRTNCTGDNPVLSQWRYRSLRGGGSTDDFLPMPATLRFGALHSRRASSPMLRQQGWKSVLLEMPLKHPLRILPIRSNAHCCFEGTRLCSQRLWEGSCPSYPLLRVFTSKNCRARPTRSRRHRPTSRFLSATRIH